MNLSDLPAADRALVIGALIDRLPDYLVSGSLFLPVMAEHGGRRDALSLTLGMLLDALEHLAAVAPADARALAGRMHEAAAHRPAEYHGKLVRELRSAAAIWRAAVDDLVREPERAADGWHEAARQRTRAAQLLAELDRIGAAPDAATQTSLVAADAVARANTVAGPFALRPAEAAIFPADRCWWLWRRPAGD